MKVETFEAARRIGRKAFEGMRPRRPPPGSPTARCAIQIEQNAGTKPLHPMSLLARAYRGNAFTAPAEVTHAARYNARRFSTTPTTRGRVGSRRRR